VYYTEVYKQIYAKGWKGGYLYV